MESATQNCKNNDYSKVCCCCLQGDYFLDICSEYDSNGLKEVYRDMLKETFNVQVRFRLVEITFPPVY